MNDKLKVLERINKKVLERINKIVTREYNRLSAYLTDYTAEDLINGTYIN